MNIEENIKLAAQQVEEAGALLFSAGAGMGVDSGLPDFRGNQGFWKAYPPIAKLGISFIEMANPQWFNSKPRLAWAFYGHRLNLYRRTKPHDGYQMLLEMAADKPGSYFVFTSNVDGHFQKAGFDEDRVAECHGSINHLQCNNLCNQQIYSAENIEVNVDEEVFEAHDPLPECPYCGSLARPNVLMFGDWAWLSHRTDRQETNMAHWLDSLSGMNIAIIECGAGTAVPTVRYQSESIARRFNGKLIRINPRDYSVPAGHIAIPAGALQGIKKIYERIR